jgi:hypothetical protein
MARDMDHIEEDRMNKWENREFGGDFIDHRHDGNNFHRNRYHHNGRMNNEYIYSNNNTYPNNSNLSTNYMNNYDRPEFATNGRMMNNETRYTNNNQYPLNSNQYSSIYNTYPNNSNLSTDYMASYTRPDLATAVKNEETCDCKCLNQ